MVSQFRLSIKMVYSARYHVVWCPRGRRRVLVGRVADRLEAILRRVVAELGGEVLGLEVMPDQVHRLVGVPLSRLLQALKGRSSRRLRRLPVLWSLSWFVFTVGGAPGHVVKRYVENQKRAA